MSNFDDNFSDDAPRTPHPEYEEFAAEAGLYEEPNYGRRAVRSVEDDILIAIEMVNAAKPLPLSNSVKIVREELIQLLSYAAQNLPYELAEARRALREREALMAEAQAEAQDIIERAQSYAAQLIEQTVVVREARLEAQSIINEATVAARKMVTQHEDYLDRKLADFENILSNLLATTQKGRLRLSAEPMPMPTDTVAIAEQFFAAEPTSSDAPFDYEAEVGSTDGNL
jgi:F0F1-type ATP synthase membrane subunit b/b'